MSHRRQKIQVWGNLRVFVPFVQTQTSFINSFTISVTYCISDVQELGYTVYHPLIVITT